MRYVVYQQRHPIAVPFAPGTPEDEREWNANLKKVAEVEATDSSLAIELAKIMVPFRIARGLARHPIVQAIAGTTPQAA